MKKIILLFCVAICLFANFVPVNDVFAEEQSLEDELSDTVQDELEKLDLSAMEKFLQDFCNDSLNIFNGTSITEKIQEIISGDFKDSADNVLVAILNLVFDEILSFLPMIALILGIAILASLLSDLKGSNNSIGNIIHFVCYGVVIIVVCGCVAKMIALTGEVLQSMLSQMEVVFPILLTLLTAIGGTVSASVYQPAVAVLTGGVTVVFTNILMPIFIFTIVFSIVSNLSTSVKLNKISGFLSSLFKWIIGITFTIFMGFLAIKGITAGSVDSIAFKTARYSLSAYIPIVGGYLSEGLNVIIASCLLIKSAVGTCGILLLLTSIILPLIELILFNLSLKLTGAILEPLADGRISNFVSSVSKAMVMPIAMICAVAFMYVIFVGLIMCTSVSL